jgi:hypothetical protein
MKKIFHNSQSGVGARQPWAIGGVVLFLWLSLSAQAQWVTQTNCLKAGWNAIYLHVDVSYDTLDNQLRNVPANSPNTHITEVWLWTPASSTMQFITSPQNPVVGSQWICWNRQAANGASLLQGLIANAAYLVRADADCIWSVKGKPVAPRYQWTTTGLNFLGFPTVTAPVTTPDFEHFLTPAPELYQNAEIYQYIGGDLGSNNPVRVYAVRGTPVTRGQAFWIRSGNVFNRYFGPFEVVWSGGNGIDYGQSLGSASFRLRNLTTSELTVTVRLVKSEGAPTGQTTIVGTPPLLVRGSLSTIDLTYQFATLSENGSYSWTLPGQGQPGSEIEVVLGLDRSAIQSNPGELLAGVLRFTDSLNFAQVDAPVAASAGSSAGLWVGGVSVNQVGEYLKTYARDTTDSLLIDDQGHYIVSEINTNIGSVGRPFPLRLIIHNPESSGNAVLLQHVFYGLDAMSNAVVATTESALNPNYLNQARRISATHLPWTTNNTTWAFNGRLGLSANLKATVQLGFNDQASNPFVHTYHPDHDNLDDTFTTPLKQGAESYSVNREIRLQVVVPSNDFGSRTSTGQTLSGNYSETITVLGLDRSGSPDTRTFESRGFFSLNRIAENPTLTTAP